MLWIEYKSSHSITKRYVERIVSEIARLIHPDPVAAEDRRADGFAMIAHDGYEEKILRSMEFEDPKSSAYYTNQSMPCRSCITSGLVCDCSRPICKQCRLRDRQCSSHSKEVRPTKERRWPISRISRSSSVSDNMMEDQEWELSSNKELYYDEPPIDRHPKFLDKTPSGSVSRAAFYDNDGDYSQTLQESELSNSGNSQNSISSGNGNMGSSGENCGTDEADGRETAVTRESALPSISKSAAHFPAIFMGRLNFKTREGYQQVLEIRFEPNISAQCGALQRVQNTISMERVNVTATRVSVPRSERPETNKEEEGLDPYFVTETITITTGVSGGVCIGPDNYEPKEIDFYGARTVARRYQVEASVRYRVAPAVQ